MYEAKLGSRTRCWGEIHPAHTLGSVGKTCTRLCALARSYRHSPIGSPIELGMHHGGVHAGPVGGSCQVIFVDTVLEAIRDPA